MNKIEFEEYVWEECKRQWHECQEEDYGAWEIQSKQQQEEYYQDMRIHLKGRIIADGITQGVEMYWGSDKMQKDIELLKAIYQADINKPMPSDEEIRAECSKKLADKIEKTIENDLENTLTESSCIEDIINKDIINENEVAQNSDFGGMNLC